MWKDDDDDDGVTFELTVKGWQNTGFYLLVRTWNIADDVPVKMEGHECEISARHMQWKKDL